MKEPAILHGATRQAISPAKAKGTDTAPRRRRFPGTAQFRDGEIRLLDTRSHRLFVGRAVPGKAPLVLTAAKETGTPGLPDRREPGVVNMGAPGRVGAAGQGHAMARGDVLGPPLGSGPVTFSVSARAALPARQLTPETAPTPGPPCRRSGGEGIRILMNTAGIIRRADAVDFTEADRDAVIDRNQKAVFPTARALARALMARSAPGAVVSFAPLRSFQGGIRVPARAAGKRRVAGLTRALANESAGQGIKVTAIAPRDVETDNTKTLRAASALGTGILARMASGIGGPAGDTSGAAVLLASPAAACIHGTILPVKGGWLAR